MECKIMNTKETPEQNLSEFIIENLRNTAMSTREIHIMIQAYDGFSNQFTTGGYMRAMADLGHVERRRVGPAWMYTLTKN